jgi:RecG-like helicase
MRPDILNPLFAEVETMPGVGPQVAKLLKRLDVTRVVDLLYHLPTGVIERCGLRRDREPARLQRHSRPAVPRHA